MNLTVVDCFTWQEHILHFDVLNCLEFKSLSPLYECLISKVSSSAQNCGHRWRVPCLNWDSASSTAYVPWDYRKLGVWDNNLSLLIWRGKRKRINQAAAQGKASKTELRCGVIPRTCSRVRGPWCPPAAAGPTLIVPHWQNSRTLNDMMLKCLDSHSGWTADAILYIVRSLHHQVFLEISTLYVYSQPRTCTTVASLHLPAANADAVQERPEQS